MPSKSQDQAKFAKIMGEYKSGGLHSSSKTGPVVRNPKQAKAIAENSIRKMHK